ncbi:MAG TPA: hypothetical protein VNV86_20650 [Candidatus Acidoferrum sp.]|jgi:hypothetical protein|nr:hypothetical protein [Candidatus Acidoferrum sp.]
MSLKEKVQVVLLSVVTAVAISMAVGKMFFAKIRPFSGGSEDAPIIMAGGSLYIGTGPDGVFQPNGNTLAFTSGFKVSSIELTDQNDNTQTAVENDVAGKTGAIIVTYCKSNCAQGNGTDTVTLNFDPNSITVSNTLPGHPISKMSKILPTLREHMRKHWNMVSVELKINGATFGNVAQCGNDSECDVVIHTCLAGTGCH